MPLHFPREHGADVTAAVIPVALFALVLGSAPPHPRHLKQIGWGLTAASVCSVVSLIVGMR